jgi:outer membrane protein, heavy metal efflux system
MAAMKCLKVIAYLTLMGVLLAFFAMSPLQAAEKDRVLNEQQVMALFFDRNLDLIAAHYQIDRAEAEEWIAAAIPNPYLSIGINEFNGNMTVHPPINTPGLGMNIIITQLFETNGKRDLRIESSQIGREAVEVDFKDSVRILANTVRHAYFTFLLAQKSLEVTRINAQRYEEIVKANQLRHAAGDIAESDLVRVEVESLKAKGDVDKAVAVLKGSRSELARLLSWPEGSMDFTVEEAWPEVPKSLENPDDTGLVNKAYETRPDYKAQSLRAHQMEKEVELARRLVVPDVTVSAGYVNDSGNVVRDSGIFNISAPIPVFNQFKGVIGKAVVGLNDARLQKEQIRNAIRKEVVTAHAELKSAEAVVSRYQTEVNQRIEKVREAVEFAYSQGAIGLIDLLDAERSYKAMMLDYYLALNNKALAYADLLMAMGEEPRP